MALHTRTIEIDLCRIDDTWAGGPTASLLRNYNVPIDGHAVALRTRVVRTGVTEWLGEAPIYDVGLWSVFGDPRIASEVSRMGWHPPFVALRGTVALVHGGKPTRIVFPAGLYAECFDKKGMGLWMREMTASELSSAPPVIQEMARRSKLGCPALETGMLCLDRNRAQDLYQIAKKTLALSTAKYAKSAHFVMDVPLVLLQGIMDLRDDLKTINQLI